MADLFVVLRTAGERTEAVGPRHHGAARLIRLVGAAFGRSGAWLCRRAGAADG